MIAPLRALLLVTLMPFGALADEHPVTSPPFPTLETGMHTAMINRFAVDRAGRFGVSASDDKTARVWDLQTGLLLRTLRVPMGPDDEGKLYAVALSPDGATVAVGGYTGRYSNEHSVYFFDRASGHLKGRITNLPNVVFHLDWSPDGKALAMALAGPNGVRLHAALPPYTERARDSSISRDSYSVDFAPDGSRLVSTSYDGKLRLYDAALRLLVPPRPLESSRRPFFAGFAPDGQRIAVGFADNTTVQLLSGTDLTPLAILDTRQANQGDLSKVVWSSDGRRLYAAGRNRLAGGRVPIRVLDPLGGREEATWPAANNVIMDLQPLADGRLVFAAGTPAWGIIGTDGQRLIHQDTPLPDHRGNFDGFRLSSAGDQLRFTHETWRDGRWQSHTLGFDVRHLRLTREDSPGTAELHPPRQDGLAVKDWFNAPHPSVSGLPLQLKEYEMSGSLSIAADTSHFALGTSWYVRWYKSNGQLLWAKPVPGSAWLVNTSADGRFVVAALGDGTIRWYRTADNSEALALFVHADAERWVAWTPEGFFAASAPEAEKLFGYTLNQGRDKEATFISSAQLRKVFYRPDLLTARIEGNEAAIAAAVAQVGDVHSILAQTVPPEVELLSAAEADVDGDYELKLNITPRSGGVGRVQIRLNGVEQAEGREVPLGGLYSQRLRYTPGSYTLQVSVYDTTGKVASESRSVRLTVRGVPPKPRLHVLAVGVSQTTYEDNKLATPGVEFADRDARAFAEQLVAQGSDGRLYRAVSHQVLTRRSETSRAAIEAALTGIPFEQGDTVVIFLAGHGKALDGRYHFLPADLQLENSDSIRNNALTQVRLQEQLRRFANGRVLLVLDTCHAGAMVEDRGLDEAFAIDNLMRESGRAILAASKSDEQAFQDRRRQHGIFTLSLLEGLANADFDKDKVVDVEELTKHLQRDMPARSRQANPNGPRQTPMRSPTANAFPLVPVGRENSK